ncbi:hypothetical protein KY495_04235 [Massilia sp. PAMC28688]|uniref:hypothetical protein n=1 Tax=Massilia sp. PAMC28688 TaxID=2861283 RepID=UPI001C6388A7|nr:hypothetical protein [Massilia sp. PAMC28688]QYF94433.1 hypothetical protein KY495_04235 [Massilia sp. PAMC28688]
MSDTSKKELTRAERKEALIAQCAAQRTQMGREIEVMRAPSVLTGGGIGQYFSGGVKAPLAIAGLALAAFAARSQKLARVLTTGMSVYKLAKGGLTMLRNRAV